MKYSNEYILSLKRFRQMLNLVALIGFFVQIAFNYSYDNILCNILIIGAFLPACNILISTKNRHIGSAFLAVVIFLNIASNSIVPVIGTLLDGRTVTYSLTNATEVYFHRFIYCYTILIAFYFAKKRNALSLNASISRLAEKLKVNRLESEKTLWVMGILGFVGFLTRYIGLPDELAKFFEGFNFLLNAPFILLIYKYPNSIGERRKRLYLFGYFVLQIILSFVTNSRSAIIAPIALVFSAWLVLLLNGKVFIDIKLIRKVFFLTLIGIYLLGVFMDLSTAILMSRGVRTTTTVDELITETLKNFSDKEAIDKYKNSLLTYEINQIQVGNDVWLENYLRNPFLARFVSIKFDDNLFYRLAEYNNDNIEHLQQVTLDKTLVVFPTPILKLFGATLDKKFLNSFSMADIMDVLSGRGFLGGLKTGSILANAYGIFGWWYPLFLYFIYYLLFSIYGGLVSRPFKFDLENPISTLALLLPFSVFVGTSFDGVPSLTSSLIRSFAQTVFIYYLTLHIIKRFRVK